MRIVCKLSGWAAAVACATACTHAPRSEPVYLTMTVQSTQCVLEEIGSGYKANIVRFKGSLREIDPQVFRCSVEVPKAEFEGKLGVCTMRGYPLSSGSLFKGDRTTRRSSCDMRPLRNSNMYVEATGIDQDSCDWICTPAASR